MQGLRQVLARQLLQPIQTLRKPQGEKCFALLGLITHQPAVVLGRLIHDLDAEVCSEVMLAGLIEGRQPRLLSRNSH